jgi:uncharacterized protein YndB with AHSA1/START domain
MTETDMRTIEHAVLIAAPPETVWKYWTDPARLASWWGVATQLDTEPGGGCRIEMAEGPVMIGEFLELVPHERIVLSFGWEGNAPGEPLAPGSTRVEVTLEPTAGGTQLTLRHHDMPESHAADHATGWDHFLAVLADSVAASAIA